MKKFGVNRDPQAYGERWADFYDEWVASSYPPQWTEQCVAFLLELAGSGPVLELGVGTGRLALPLLERGLQVHGIEASQAMVDKLREKPGGEAIPITVGDLADVGVEGKFSLIFAAFNTFFALGTQKKQIRCLKNVASHMTDGGKFVIEVMMPDFSPFRANQASVIERLDDEEVWVRFTQHDPIKQTLEGQLVRFGSGKTTLYPSGLRYSWPPEIDLMAEMAGLRLKERLGGWGRFPFSSFSSFHVSIFEAAGN